MDFGYCTAHTGAAGPAHAFMDEHVYPAEARYADELRANTEAGKRWTPLQVIEELKPKARAAGLWNLFLPDSELGAGLTNQDYAPLAEIMGRVPWASEVFNCSAPDTGNMEVLVRYGTPEHQKKWLQPLLAGEIRSAFAMTEPAVASSDATNIESRIERRGDQYVINGRKWWTSGAGDPRCKIMIFMGKTDPAAPRHSQQSMILVPIDTPGVKIMRPLQVFGYDDAPHGHMEVDFKDVTVPASQHAARRRPRLRDRAGPPRARAHPPLHAPDRPGRARARADVQARACRAWRSASRGAADGDAGAHRRGALHDRAGAPADAEGGVDDGHGRQQGAPRPRSR